MDVPYNSQLGASAVSKRARPADAVAQDAERLIARLSDTLREVSSLRDRIAGPRPEGNDERDTAATAINVGGFVGGVGSMVERAHIHLTRIDDVLREINEVV